MGHGAGMKILKRGKILLVSFSLVTTLTELSQLRPSLTIITTNKYVFRPALISRSL